MLIGTIVAAGAWAVGHYALTSLTSIACNPGVVYPKHPRETSQPRYPVFLDILSGFWKMSRVKTR